MSCHLHSRWPAALLLATLLLAGCGDGGETREITKERELAAPRRIAAGIPSTLERLGFRAPPPSAGHGATGPASYAWTLPPGWEDLQTSQFRQGNWRVNGEPDVQAYLTVLPGTGGGVLGNINRWRGQMSLDPVTEEDVAGLSTLPVLGRQAFLVELNGTFRGMGEGASGEGYRLVGVIVPEHQGSCVTVKLVGPAAKVEKAKPAFLELCRSLKASSPAAPPAAGHGGTGTGLKYTVPEGWRLAEPRQFREVNLYPAEGEDTECYVTVLAGAAGGIEANINRWRRQMGQPDLSPEEIKALPAVRMFNRDAKVVEIEGTYRGMGGSPREGYMMLAAILQMPGSLLTVKMTGPADVVKAKKEEFLAFCRSLHV